MYDMYGLYELYDVDGDLSDVCKIDGALIAISLNPLETP